ncbi:methylmalonyl-CoA mutase family protein [Dyadobacter subterraneus]|uniref:Methylmalonyl-CoA mutase n=1 Tax=Dyadobacter subterraneus TaxID=2773304 RepID=A0ABR9WF46_9BACT|nr:methylmalonyl-CoA mutase family protein [Dyadobacter subterraneus]MBE9464122.1 methylmalonyl-CoA mutase [Dyadobacter subterraneus]
MSKLHFSEFNSSQKEAWKKQAEKELGENKTKIGSWEIASDLFVDPYYTAEDVDNEQISNLQKAQKKIPGWLNIPFISFDNAWATNTKIKSSLESGADAAILDLKETDLVKSELSKTLHGIRLSETAIFFRTTNNSEKLFKEIPRGAGYYLKGGIYNDPLANWMHTGNDFQEAQKNICNVLEKTKMMREFRPLMIESHVFHNAGANVVQELAFLLASTVHYLDKLTDAGISPLHALNRFFYSVSVGTEYLIEIAKLRALRFLYRKISRAYQIPDELCHVFIHTQTSSFYDSAYSSENNLIRNTSEAMSAVTGGCDGLTVIPLDNASNLSTEFSERIARNISSLLGNESYLSAVADPAAGSYQLDMMSLKIADAAWKLFLLTEEKGGLIPCFQNGFIQSEIEDSWEKKITDFNNEKVMIGVNKYKTNEKIDESQSFDTLENNKADSKLLPNRNLPTAILRK